MKIKQYIDVFLSSVAMLALLLHGIIPHHHHDTESEKCNLEEHSQSIQHFANSIQSNTFNCDINCCEDSPSHSHAHVCNLNITSSKQATITLLAVIKSFNFQKKSIQSEVFIFPDSRPFTTSNLPEAKSLRAPPLA